MTVDSDFFNQQSTIDAMARLRDADPLVVFAGAGLPASIELPTWEQLLRALLTEVVAKGIGLATHAEQNTYVDTLLESYPAPFLGSLVRDALPDPPTFARELHRHLYETHREHFRTSFGANFPRALGELLVRRINDGCETVVVTTNFDDSIEHTFNHDPVIRAITEPRLVLKPRYLKTPPRGKHILPVHHIHGFLPREVLGAISQKQEIIFSERDFTKPWKDHWSHDLLMGYADAQWFFVGMSFQDPHVSFYLAQRQNVSPSGPSPIGMFSLQGKRWRALQGTRVLAALLGAEIARLRELGMFDVLVTRFYFQDAHFLRELSHDVPSRGIGYCDRRRDWFRLLEENYLKQADEERFIRSQEFNAVLRSVRRLTERNLRLIDPLERETIKVELYARDPNRRSLFLIASSESVLLDPARSRRFPLTLDDSLASAAVRAFTKGMPGMSEKAGLDVHGRWNSFWATPVMLGGSPWNGFPVGALVVCTTHSVDDTSLRWTIPNIESELHAAVQRCARLLDPLERLADAPPVEDLKKALRETIERQKGEEYYEEEMTASNKSLEASEEES